MSANCRELLREAQQQLEQLMRTTTSITDAEKAGDLCRRIAAELEEK